MRALHDRASLHSCNWFKRVIITGDGCDQVVAGVGQSIGGMFYC